MSSEGRADTLFFVPVVAIVEFVAELHSHI